MLAIIGKVAAGGILGLLLLGVIWVVSALFWGWILMLLLGIFGATHDGHSIGMFPMCFGAGFLISLVLG